MYTSVMLGGLVQLILTAEKGQMGCGADLHPCVGHNSPDHSCFMEGSTHNGLSIDRKPCSLSSYLSVKEVVPALMADMPECACVMGRALGMLKTAAMPSSASPCIRKPSPAGNSFVPLTLLQCMLQA